MNGYQFMRPLLKSEYEELKAGVYQNMNRGRQLLRFDGFQYGNVTPTDIDGHIDYRDCVAVFFEAKLKGKDVPRGQRVALERLVKDAGCAHKHAIAIIMEHDVSDCARDVWAVDCTVREIYTTEKKTWRAPKWPIKAKEMVDAYINYFMNFTA